MSNNRKGVTLKDWQPGFAEEMSRMYREGNAKLAERLEREGSMTFAPPAKHVGDVAETVLARIRPARGRK